jgi:cytochrome o ubiquinol oxidase subunit 1
MSSPPAVYNFSEIPRIHGIDAFMDMKERGIAYRKPDQYRDIHMPKNTGAGFVMGVLSFLFGFAMIWHIWWLAVVAVLGVLGTLIARASHEDTEYTVPAAEVERLEKNRFRQLAAAGRSLSGSLSQG